MGHPALELGIDDPVRYCDDIPGRMLPPSWWSGLKRETRSICGALDDGHDASFDRIDVLGEQPWKLVLRKREESVLVNHDVLRGFKRGKAADEVRGTLIGIRRECGDVHQRTDVRRLVGGLRDDDTTKRMTNDHHRRFEVVDRP